MNGKEKARSSQGNSHDQNNENKEHSIVIRELPPVTINTLKDWADWGYWGFSLGLLIVGGFQVWLVWKTLGAIKRQADIANRTLIAQFRPKVIVRYIELYNGAGLWGIHLLVGNTGGTNATIKDGKIEVRWRVGNERRYDPLHRGSIEGFSLGAGEEQSFNIAISDNSRFDSKMHVFRLALEEGRPEKYLMQAVGEVRYVDDSGAGKKTGFFRVLDIQSLRFAASQNTEDEYQD